MDGGVCIKKESKVTTGREEGLEYYNLTRIFNLEQQNKENNRSK